MILSSGTRSVRNWVAWLLIITMFFCSYFGPLAGGIQTAYAEGTDDESIIEEFQNQEDDTVQEPEISYLDKAKKEDKPIKVDEECDELTTVFQNPDGTKTAYIFETAVRFKDEQGKWQEIDNQLIEASEEKKNNGYKYTNKSNEFDVYLPENMASDVPVVLEFDDYKIEMEPIQIKDTKKEDKDKYDGKTNIITVDLIKNEKKFDKKSDKDNAITKGEAEDIAKSVKYNSGFDDSIELVYTPTDNGVKEEIVLNEYTGQNEFSFLVKMEGVVPVQLEDGRIALHYIDTDEFAGMFTEMYMYDSYDGEEKLEGEHLSEEVTYELEDGKEKGE